MGLGVIMKVFEENIYYKRFKYFNVYIIRGKNGDILIDSGFVLMKKSLKKYLDKFNIKLIILTHAHVDHAWNVAYLKRLYKCEVLMGSEDVINIDNSNIKTYPSKKIFNLWTKLMSFGMQLFKQELFKPNILVNKDTVFKYYGLNLKIVTLEGHTNGSIGVYYKGYLFAGDALVNRGRYVSIAYQNQDNIKSLNTFKKIFNLKPKIIFVGHDKPINKDKLDKSYKKYFD